MRINQYCLNFKTQMSILFLPLLINNCSKSVKTQNEKTVTSQQKSKDVLGDKALGAQDFYLQQIRSTSASLAPALIRPDPDLVMKNLLKSMTPNNLKLSKQLGVVEKYRLLLGGAPEDLSTSPQFNYDSTSLITIQSLSSTVCSYILSNSSFTWSAKDSQIGVSYLAQRITGLSSNSGEFQENISSWQALVPTTPNSYSEYSNLCMTLMMDPYTLYL
jgi:hypothetical protein